METVELTPQDKAAQITVRVLNHHRKCKVCGGPQLLCMEGIKLQAFYILAAYKANPEKRLGTNQTNKELVAMATHFMFINNLSEEDI